MLQVKYTVLLLTPQKTNQKRDVHNYVYKAAEIHRNS